MRPARRSTPTRASRTSRRRWPLAYRLQPDKTLYATVGRGYKAGGFNPASPAGSEAYGEEQTWHFEGGVKTLWANGRVSANAAVFYIDWDDLQLNVPNPAVPAQFYISNVGGAVSKGVELEVSARPAPGVDLFTAVGYTHARFAAGSVSGGVERRRQQDPEHAGLHGQRRRAVLARRRPGDGPRPRRRGVLRRVPVQRREHPRPGRVLARQPPRRRRPDGSLIGEVFVRNAFDTRYIPLAFPYPSFAPSGFMGEMGAPRTVGVSVGVRF